MWKRFSVPVPICHSPGGAFFNFAGFGKTEAEMKKLKVNEIKNGRLVCFLSMQQFRLLSGRLCCAHLTPSNPMDAYVPSLTSSEIIDNLHELVMHKGVRASAATGLFVVCAAAGHACHVRLRSTSRHHWPGSFSELAGPPS